VNGIRNYKLGAGALALAAAALGVAAWAAQPSAPVNGQNWTRAEQIRWYRGTQGSRLIPERWLDALEAPGSAIRFMDPAHFDQFLYLPRDGADDPEPWPIGFARDDQSDSKLNVTRLRWFAGQKDKEPWIGLNCAACHTAEIGFRTADGQSGRVRVDGAPTMADFQGFTDRLLEAMRETWRDAAKWDRFAARALTPRGREKVRDTAGNRAMLREAFGKLLDHQEALARFNATDSDYGHARLDAVGHILNKVAMLTEAPGQLAGPPDAPVSYPFIWNAAQHDFLQWNGIVPNDKLVLGGRSVDVGALVRNTSEVIGVFADVKLTNKPGWSGFRSSVRMRELMAMEIQLSRLMSPKWPDALGKPDPAQARIGERLFLRDCAGCHASLDRKDLKTPIKAVMTPVWDPVGIGTDEWMACNAFSYQAFGGVLTGTPENVVGGDPQQAIAPTRLYLKTEAIGTLLAQKWKIIWNALKIWAGRPPDIDIDARPPLEADVEEPPTQKSREERRQECIAKAAELPTDQNASELRILAYKGRPLNGIWATAPYLHNGSVKSLFELLLAPSKRDREFWVGNRELDPVNVGFRDVQTRYGTVFRTHDSAGKPIHGNSNAGHDYRNAAYSDPERWALVEYMKTL
jgi:hypothetical protein